jgi:branched-chain amino acid transport system substrate-binding protein
MIVMKKISVVVFLLGLALVSCKKEIAYDYQVVEVAGLFSLSGNLSSNGIASREALHLAINDVNDKMQQSGLPYRFSSSIYDTKQDAEKAVEAMQIVYGRNIRFVLGPKSSTELQAIYSFANAKQIMVISSGSTASYLGLPGDAVFRLCPDGNAQGSAIAKAIFRAGKTSLIAFSRDDPGNNGLRLATVNRFKDLGGVVEEFTSYPTNTTNYTSILIPVKTAIENQTSVLGPGYVAVFIAAFDEVKDLMRQADSYPSLSSVKWYGNDGVVKGSILSDPLSSRFAAEAQFTAIGLGIPTSNSGKERISQSIKLTTGIEPDVNALCIYDAMCLIANTVVEVKGNLDDFSKLKQVFKTEADRYSGITGPTTLNAAGDRADAVFYYWQIVRDNANYKWIKTNSSNGSKYQNK